MSSAQCRTGSGRPAPLATPHTCRRPFPRCARRSTPSRSTCTPRRRSPLVRFALIHYQSEAIHPFSDGNGRVGRLLLTLLMLQEKLLPEPLLYLSAFFERHRREYYDHLLAVSQAGRWGPWIRFFLAGVSEQSRVAVRTANELMDLQEEYKTNLRAADASDSAHRFAEHLFSYPAVTIAAVAKDFSLTQKGAGLVVNKLVKAGVLEEITGRRRNGIFLAKRITSIVQGRQGPATPSSEVGERTQVGDSQASQDRSHLTVGGRGCPRRSG